MEEWQLWGPAKTSFPSLCNPEQLTSHSEGPQFPQLENGGDTIKNSWVQILNDFIHAKHQKGPGTY